MVRSLLATEHSLSKLLTDASGQLFCFSGALPQGKLYAGACLGRGALKTPLDNRSVFHSHSAVGVLWVPGQLSHLGRLHFELCPLL